MAKETGVPESPAGGIPEPVRKLLQRKWAPVLLAAVVLVVVGGLAVGLLAGGGESTANQAETWAVRRGPLQLTVNESGLLQAEHVVRIASKVEENTTIIYLIPEGTQVTEEDVKKGKVLVELDSASLKDRATRQEVTVENARASYTRATEDYEIQVKQNESDIRAAELNVKFARMELEQYLGSELAGCCNESTDFTRLFDNEQLGGSALKQKKKLRADLQLADSELQRASDKLAWTEKLLVPKYVSEMERDADKLAKDAREADLEQAKLALALFREYQLPKDAESRYTTSREKILELDRVRSRVKSQLAQAQAQRKSAEATYMLETNKLGDLNKQIANCTIRVEKPGLVVYASSTDMFRRMREPILEGTSVRPRQEIIQLPDLSSMTAVVKVHESAVKKVARGQQAVLKVDAFPDVRFKGTVTQVGALPDPQNIFEDIKVFSTTILVENNHVQLRPGMSCQAEITVASLPDTLYVPVQAVTAYGNARVCYLFGSRPQMRPVETGEFDDRFVEIKSGLREGERVLLNPPLMAPSSEQEQSAVGKGIQGGGETKEPAGQEEKPSPSAGAEKEKVAVKTPEGRGGGAEAAASLALGGQTGTGEGAQGGQQGPGGSWAGGGNFRAMMEKLAAAGITRERMREWSTGQPPTAEEIEQLKAAGLTEEMIQRFTTPRGDGRGGGQPGREPGWQRREQAEPSAPGGSTEAPGGGQGQQ